LAGAGKNLISAAPYRLPKYEALRGLKMLMTSNAGDSGALDSGLFNQIAMFSASGLAMSMALIAVGGLQFLYPWF
jgi:hypothetical protein